jgi:hypothetical protein
VVDVEVDKIPGYWVLTLWLPNDITLRLKVRHTCSEEPDDCIAEIRLKPDEEFQAIHEFSTAVYALSHPDEYPDVWDDMPSLRTREFATLAHMWARLTEIAESQNGMPRSHNLPATITFSETLAKPQARRP